MISCLVYIRARPAESLAGCLQEPAGNNRRRWLPNASAGVVNH